MNRTLKTLAMLAILGTVPSFAGVGDITLTDGNSSAVIDPITADGMKSWEVDGLNHLFQQWFWYRIGAAGGESSIDTIGGPAVNIIGPNAAKLTYTNASIKVETTYILTGGALGSNRSDILESLRITNMGTESNTFHFYQYTDFDMGGTSGGDTVIHANANTFDQFDGVFGSSETISSPVASHWEAGNWPGILNSLLDGNPTTLGDVNNAVVPGDCSFAWQWDFTLGAGASFVISKDKNITPEPATFVTLGLGLAGLLAARRRRS